MIWLLRLEFDLVENSSYQLLDSVSSDFRHLIATHLWKKEFIPNSIPLQVSMDSMAHFFAYLQRQVPEEELQAYVAKMVHIGKGSTAKKAPKTIGEFGELLRYYPEGTVLNCISMVDQIRQVLGSEEEGGVERAYDKPMNKVLSFLVAVKEQCPVKESSKILQIATLFNRFDLNAIKEWNIIASDSRTLVKQEWDKVIIHRLSNQ